MGVVDLGGDDGQDPAAQDAQVGGVERACLLEQVGLGAGVGVGVDVGGQGVDGAHHDVGAGAVDGAGTQCVGYAGVAGQGPGRREVASPGLVVEARPVRQPRSGVAGAVGGGDVVGRVEHA